MWWHSGVFLLRDLPHTEDDADRSVIPFVLLLDSGNGSEHVPQLLSSLVPSHRALWTCACLIGVTYHFLLDNGDSIPVLQLIVLGTLMTTSLSMKD